MHFQDMLHNLFYFYLCFSQTLRYDSNTGPIVSRLTLQMLVAVVHYTAMNAFQTGMNKSSKHVGTTSKLHAPKY